MTPPKAVAGQGPRESPLTPARGETLALLFQEVLTGIVRLRSDRQEVSNAESFRIQIRSAISATEKEACAAGYNDDDIRLAVYAIVAFLDESVLNSRKAIFRDWVRRPLQEELFGQHVAGEKFYEYLQEILGRRETPGTADLLEVYHLCLLLGFQGRYSTMSRAELYALNDQIRDKVRRIRNETDELSPAWRPPEAGAQFRRDPWTRRLTLAAAGAAALCLILFILYKLSLGGGAQLLKELAGNSPK